MDRYINALKEIGLTDKESRVYIALLELGKASAYALAEKSKLKRPTTYNILSELVQKGLAIKVPRVKKQNFIAVTPEEYYRTQEKRLLHSKSILPELIALSGKAEQKTKVKYYEGVRGVQEALSHGLNNVDNKELVGFFAMAENIPPEIIKVCEKWGNDLFKTGISLRGFTPSHPYMHNYIQNQKNLGSETNIRLLPEAKYSSNASIDIGSSFIRIIMYAETQAVVIENAELAKTMKQVFELLWEKEKGEKQ